MLDNVESLLKDLGNELLEFKIRTTILLMM